MKQINLLNKTPDKWENLEELTELLFQRTGHKTKRKKIVQLVRGKVEVDVFAIKPGVPTDFTIVCECKNWNKKISQTTVHSFRTVVSEIGANVGYIISKNGYQKGAIESAKNSNIELLAWDNLQNKFREEYLNRYVYPKIEEYCYEPNHFFFSDFFQRLRRDERDITWRIRGYYILEATYQPIVALYRMYYSMSIDIMPKEIIANDPLFISIDKIRPIGQKIIKRLALVENYDDFLEIVFETTEEMKKEFRNLMAD